MPPPRLPKRKRDTHKGDYGRVLVVAGSRGMMGAAVLAGEAALRSGAGLVTLVVPRSLVEPISIKQTCGTVQGVDDTGDGALATTAAKQILQLRSDALVIGPGLGLDPRTASCVRDLVSQCQIPFVLDADGLNALAEQPDILSRRATPHVLTPHSGEMSRLLRLPLEEIRAQRKTVAQQAARQFRAVCILKGHHTIVTDGKKTTVNQTGNPGMATGGSGDVLAGILGALLAQKLSPYDAARLGTHVHGLAGDLAARKKGEISLIATDILEALPDAFRRMTR